MNEAISRLNFYENPGIAYTLEQKYLLENNLTKEQMCMKKYVAPGEVKKQKKNK